MCIGALYRAGAVAGSRAVGAGGDPDPDGIIRRVPLVVGVGDKLYPTLAGDALRVGVGGQTGQVRLTQDVFIDKMRIGEAIIPVNDRGELLL